MALMQPSATQPTQEAWTFIDNEASCLSFANCKTKFIVGLFFYPTLPYFRKKSSS